MEKSTYSRKAQLAKFKAIINRDSYPRLEMFILVSFTGLAGFLTSYYLLHFGVTTIWLRYLISMGSAYIIFLALLGVWLSLKTNRITTDLDILDDIDFALSMNSSSPQSSSFQGHGGTFDGAGASADYTSDISSSDSGAIGDVMGAVAEAEEGAIPLVVIGTLIFALFSILIITFSLVASAPILFSELLVDGMLSASLYRRLKAVDRRHWLESAMKRTIWPFVSVTVIFVIVGLIIGHYMPEIHSLGELISYFRN